MFDPATIAANLRSPVEAGLARIEDAGLNAAQPAEQLLVDGWLLRFSPGRARRARSVNAVSAGRLDLDTKLALCRRYYERASIPLLFRVTPFSQPESLDNFLEKRDFEAIDPTHVMTVPLESAGNEGRATAIGAESRCVDVNEFAAVVGRLRGTPLSQVRAHQSRLQGSALRDSSLRRALYVDDEAVAAGQVVIEGDLAGLYDIITAPPWRGRGFGSALTALLLEDARAARATAAYLQVDAGNADARGIYAKFGFEDRYAYWYRRPAGLVDDLLH